MKFTIITERLVAADCLPASNPTQTPQLLPLPLPRTYQIDSAAQRSRKKNQYSIAGERQKGK